MIELIQTLQFVGATAPGSAEAEEAGIAALGIDPLAILAQGFTFLLLFFIIKKYALNSIVATLEKRRQTIDDGVRLGVEMEKEKAVLDQKVEKSLAEARVEADKIISSGHQDAAVIIKQAEEAASRKADAILADAQAHISEELQKARAGLEKEMAAMVADATEIIIGEKMDVQKDKGLLRRALKASVVNMAVVTRKQIAAVIVDMIRAGKPGSQLAREIAAYLVAEKRTADLNNLMRDVMALRKKHDNTMEINIESAYPLSDEIRDKVQEFFSTEHMVLNETVDARLLSGIKVEADGKVLDLTARHKLDMLKQRPARSNA